MGLIEAVAELVEEEAAVLSALTHSFASALRDVPIVTQQEEGDTSVDKPSVLLDVVGSSHRLAKLRDDDGAAVLDAAAL